MDNYIDFVRAELGEAEILSQLAEESSELAQAALKMRRVLDGKNPTPITMENAEENLHEEIADVLTCISLLDCVTDESLEKFNEIHERKMERWAKRIADDRLLKDVSGETKKAFWRDDNESEGLPDRQK